MASLGCRTAICSISFLQAPIYCSQYWLEPQGYCHSYYQLLVGLEACLFRSPPLKPLSGPELQAESHKWVPAFIHVSIQEVGIDLQVLRPGGPVSTARLSARVPCL